jgi:hypothetical protein
MNGRPARRTRAWKAAHKPLPPPKKPRPHKRLQRLPLDFITPTGREMLRLLRQGPRYTVELYYGVRAKERSDAIMGAASALKRLERQGLVIPTREQKPGRRARILWTKV